MPRKKSTRKRGRGNNGKKSYTYPGRATTIRFNTKTEMDRVRDAAELDKRPFTNFITTAAVNAADEVLARKSSAK